jgi:hypothetical protein
LHHALQYFYKLFGLFSVLARQIDQIGFPNNQFHISSFPLPDASGGIGQIPPLNTGRGRVSPT